MSARQFCSRLMSIRALPEQVSIFVQVVVVVVVVVVVAVVVVELPFERASQHADYLFSVAMLRPARPSAERSGGALETGGNLQWGDSSASPYRARSEHKPTARSRSPSRGSRLEKVFSGPQVFKNEHVRERQWQWRREWRRRRTSSFFCESRSLARLRASEHQNQTLARV